MENWRVREALAEDVPDILRMIKDLAVFEKEPESRVKLTEEEMLRDGFGEEKPWFGSVIAEVLYCPEGNHCLPKKKAVGKGIGTEMLRRVSSIAVEKGCVRVDWNCLNWNKSAKDFYDKLGAVCLDEWQLYRLTGERLLEFAAKKPKIASSCW